MTDLTQYGKYSTDMFSVRDTIGVPHPFCIGTKHVVYAADNYGGRLTKEGIEKSGIPCAERGCQLDYHEHKIALAINCKSKDQDLLNEYLLSIKEQCEKDNYAGFVLVDCTEV